MLQGPLEVQMNNSVTGLQLSCITPTMFPLARLLHAWYFMDNISRWNDSGKQLQSHSLPHCAASVWSNLTFGASRSSKMVDGPKDEPEGSLLVAADSQDLHGCLQLGELLRGPLLVFWLAGGTNTHNHHCRLCFICTTQQLSGKKGLRFWTFE